MQSKLCEYSVVGSSTFTWNPLAQRPVLCVRDYNDQKYACSENSSVSTNPSLVCVFAYVPHIWVHRPSPLWGQTPVSCVYAQCHIYEHTDKALCEDRHQSVYMCVCTMPHVWSHRHSPLWVQTPSLHMCVSVYVQCHIHKHTDKALSEDRHQSVSTVIHMSTHADMVSICL